MRIVMTGATGFIGRAATHLLASEGHRITALVRSEDSAVGLPCQLEYWDATTSTGIIDALSRAEAVIHLAGAPIGAHRWSERVKTEVRDSRVFGTRNLVASLHDLPEGKRPKVLICASAIGYYGDRAEEELDETSASGTGFLSEVTQAWEAEAMTAEKLGIRVVLPRFGIVLGPGGGALAKMLPVIIGSGRQWMSWVHLQDIIRFLSFALPKDAIRGAFNLTVQEPERNESFMRKLAKARGFRFVPRVPSWAIQLLLGEMAEMVLDSQRVLPKRTLEAQFKFENVDLEQALAQIYG